MKATRNHEYAWLCIAALGATPSSAAYRAPTLIVMARPVTCVTFPRKRFVKRCTSRFRGNAHLLEGAGERPVMPLSAHRGQIQGLPRGCCCRLRLTVAVRFVFCAVSGRSNRCRPADSRCVSCVTDCFGAAGQAGQGSGVGRQASRAPSRVHRKASNVRME
jgi:hypothetical protein